MRSLPIRHRALRRGNTALIVLLAVVGVIGIAVVWMWSRPSSQPNVIAGQSVAENFLKEIREGRAPEAWDSTTAEFKSAQGRESFVTSVKSDKKLAQPFEFVSAQTVTVQEQPRSEFLFRAADGTNVRIVLGNEAGTWKVDRWTR